MLQPCAAPSRVRQSVLKGCARLADDPSVKLKARGATTRFGSRPLDPSRGDMNHRSDSTRAGSHMPAFDPAIGLREVLEVIKTPNVVLETNAANSPAMLRPVGDESFQHIIMPMNLQR